MCLEPGNISENVIIYLKYTVWFCFRRSDDDECFVLYAFEYPMMSLQPHRSEPATRTSSGVMMADALPHPGFVTGTMTVVT